MVEISPPVGTLLAFLTEQDPSTEKGFHRRSLQLLNELSSTGWCEVAQNLSELEAYNESCGDEICQQLSALLLSQTYFHLEMYLQALQAALEAGPAFREVLGAFYPFEDDQNSGMEENPHANNPILLLYVDRIVALAIDEYIRAHSNTPVEERISNESVQIDQSRVDALVDELVSIKSTIHKNESLFSEESLKLLLGIAFEANNIESAEKILRIRSEPASFGIFRHVITNNELLMRTKTQKTEVYRLLGCLYRHQLGQLLTFVDETKVAEHYVPKISPIALDELPWYAELLMQLHDVQSMAELFVALINLSVIGNGNENEHLWLRAAQQAFDLLTSSSQVFLTELRMHPLLKVPEYTSEVPGPESEEPMSKAEVKPGDLAAGQHSETLRSSSESKNTDTPVPIRVRRLRDLHTILLGDFQTSLMLKFANQKNNTDLAILDQIKGSLDSRHAVLHTTLITAHSLMQRGTTCDVFLRHNLDWFGKTVCWGKFQANASLGVVHQTHTTKSFRVLSTYLPGINSANTSSNASTNFSDGGSLFALGLIHANRCDQHVVDYLLEQLFSGSGSAARANLGQTQPSAEGAEGAGGPNATSRATVNEVAQYGACLGLGLAAMGCATAELTEALSSVLMTDSAVSGEAAALALGLVNIGTNKPIAEELLQYAKDTRHEKIIRACALAVGLIVYKCEEQAEDIISRMIKDQDPLIRYGGCFASGLAYCGTANEVCLRHLLHLAVSDSSDDVRRAAVLAVPYVLANVPDQIPRILRLLADSFNLHVRFAAVLAVGVGCAGTGSKEALDILLPATRDSVDMVRQAAFIALGFVLMQCPEKKAASKEKSQAPPVTAAAENKPVEGDIAEEDKPAETTAATDKPVETETSAKGPATNLTSASAKGMVKKVKILPEDPSAADLREFLIEVSCDPKEDQMARVGSILGLGILDAGGRNVSCSLSTPRGQLRRESVVGFVLFSQYWFWYPLMLTISIAMMPTAIIGLTSELKVPEGFELQCNAPASAFAYPERFQPKKKEAVVDTVTTLLSATQRRLKGAPKPPVAAPTPAPRIEPPAQMADAEPVEAESSIHVVKNMSRVLLSQAPLLRPLPDARYTPIIMRRRLKMGVMMLSDSKRGQPETYMV